MRIERGECPVFPGEATDIRAEKIDLLEDGAISVAIVRARVRGSGLRVLVFCAGAPVQGKCPNAFARRLGSLHEFESSLRVHLHKAAILVIRLNRGGVIVFVSSIWAQATPPDRIAYATAKAALTTLARTCALDHAKDTRHIRWIGIFGRHAAAM